MNALTHPIRHSFQRFLLCFAAVAISLMVTTPDSRAQTRLVPDTNQQILLSFAPLVEAAQPAVVNVYARQVVQQRQTRSPFMDDPFFRRFFGDRGFGMPRERVSNSLGSGVIVDPSGLVVTNFHVIRNATEVRVALADRREIAAEIVLKDERTDLAVLRLDEGGAPYASLELGDSDAVQVGDLVLALGNPFGVGQTVTSGIVSALARNQVGVTDYQFFIQTDAAINPGNSGGALIDMQGQLVGINTAIFSRSGGSNGIGFAIPANMVQLVVASAQTGSRVNRPWIGARFQSVTPDIAEGLGLERPLGALIAGLHPQSPARRAGLEIGDVVTAVDGVEVASPDAFGYRFSTKGTSGDARLSVLRGGDLFDVSIPLMTPPEDPPRDVRELRGRSPIAGSTIANLSPAVVEEFRIRGQAERGVLITQIDPSSPARRFGLRPRDIIRTINGEPVSTTRQLSRLDQRSRGPWRIQIQRAGRIITSIIGG
ncbi:MAG: Do family serine endopeptidase [Pseudomonadota bacterium]